MSSATIEECVIASNHIPFRVQRPENFFGVTMSELRMKFVNELLSDAPVVAERRWVHIKNVSNSENKKKRNGIKD